MRKLVLVLLAGVLVSSACASSALASSPVELSVTPSVASTYLGSSVTFNLTITNNQNTYDGFTIGVSGPHLEWVNLGNYYQGVNAMSSKSVPLILYPVKYDGTFVHNITVSSFSDPGVEASKTITLTVLPVEVLSAQDFTARLSGNNLNVAVTLKSAGRKEAGVAFSVLDSKGNLITSASSTMVVNGSKEVSMSIPLPEGLLAGSYTVKMNVAGTDIAAQAGFSVEEVRNVTETKTVVSSPLYQEVTIVVRNSGNVAESGYKVYQTLDRDLLITWITSPTKIYVGEEATVNEWLIQEIGPGESATVSYRIEYWHIFAEWALVIIVIALVLLITYFRVTTPSIRKKCVSKGRGGYTITLDVKSPMIGGIKSVIVRDWVTPLARVLKKFHMAVPVVTQSDDGTELIWRLGDMKPREERVLSYTIKPVVEGSLRMPRARMSYKTAKEKKVRTHSRELTVHNL